MSAIMMASRIPVCTKPALHTAVAYRLRLHSSDTVLSELSFQRRRRVLDKVHAGDDILVGKCWTDTGPWLLWRWYRGW